MINEAEITSHYGRNDLYSRIIIELRQAGIHQPTPQDLSAVDEFHIGGTDGTLLVANELKPMASEKVLDIGCGIGGPARLIAANTGCSVTGIDLTKSFVETGNHLSRLVGLEDQVKLRTGNALVLPFVESEFDSAYMIHVGMNIGDKDKLISEAARVIKPGGRFVIYDVMQIQDATLPYPLPWAETEKTSSVSSPAAYLNPLARFGLVAISSQNKSDFALQCFERTIKNEAVNKPSALGLHLVMGPKMLQKTKNVQKQIKQGVLAPFIITATREIVS